LKICSFIAVDWPLFLEMTEQTKNSHKDFVGYKVLIDKQYKTLMNFEKWAADRDWKQFGPMNQ
jgi:hypothetical protein